MKILKGIACALALLCAAQTAAFAEGFGVYEWSASGTAMGEAYMFGENDPAVLAYNPAQITKLDGKYMSIGTSWVNPAVSSSFNFMGKPEQDWDNEYSPAVIPYFYYAQKAGKNSWWGLALFARYGNQIEYDDMWPGRYDTVYSGIKGLTLQPTYAFKINDKLSMGVGLDINYIELRMKKDVPLIKDLSKFGASKSSYLADTHSDLQGDTTSIGWVASLMYDFTPKTSMAVMYRARVKHTMDADTDFDYSMTPYGRALMAANPAVGKQLLAGLPRTSGSHGTVTLPDSITIGLGHKFNDRTRMELSAVWTNWATYDNLDIYFDAAALKNTPALARKDWKASWRLGVGIEHKLSDKWSIMGGYVFDQSPVPYDTMDFTVPTGDRHRGSIGFKYRPNANGELAFAYSAIWAGTRDVYSHVGNMDFTSAHLHDGLTQIVSLGYTIKLK
ncbi:MAG: outer membrane protein transport protein [Cloacibacillus sp.]